MADAVSTVVEGVDESDDPSLAVAVPVAVEEDSADVISGDVEVGVSDELMELASTEDVIEGMLV